MTASFAHAVREEIWIRGSLSESRLSCGSATEQHGIVVAASSRDEALISACEEALTAMRALIPGDATVRLVAEASGSAVSSMIVIRIGGLAVVSTPRHLQHDLALLRRCVDRAGSALAEEAASLPVVWRNGSAAVLLHEWIGHHSEHGHAREGLPGWLDAGVPLAPRRATFRDLPMLRMVHVRVSQTDAPFRLPPSRVEVQMVDGGAYDPASGEVTIRIAAAIAVYGSEEQALAPFELSLRGDGIRLAGASGEPVRYPGVICSREGQELYVESWAPDLLTEWR